MAKGKGKGSSFEREFSRDLSDWWSGGERKDLFWRTAMSGGMSTVTGCKNQAGDITAVCGRGARLTEAVSFELKRGYPSAKPWDFLQGGSGIQANGKLIDQADTAATQSETVWALVHKQDRKQSVLYLPTAIGEDVKNTFRVLSSMHWNDGCGDGFYAFRMKEFFDRVDPETFVKICEAYLEWKC